MKFLVFLEEFVLPFDLMSSIFFRVTVLAFLLALLLNYFAERPPRFFIPVSTLALTLRLGSFIYSWKNLNNPCRTLAPEFLKIYGEKGLFLVYLVSKSPLETSKVKVIGILIFQSIWALPVAFLASLTVKMDFP